MLQRHPMRNLSFPIVLEDFHVGFWIGDGKILLLSPVAALIKYLLVPQLSFATVIDE